LSLVYETPFECTLACIMPPNAGCNIEGKYNKCPTNGIHFGLRFEKPHWPTIGAQKRTNIVTLILTLNRSTAGWSKSAAGCLRDPDSCTSRTSSVMTSYFRLPSTRTRPTTGRSGRRTTASRRSRTAPRLSCPENFELCNKIMNWEAMENSSVRVSGRTSSEENRIVYTG